MRSSVLWEPNLYLTRLHQAAIKLSQKDAARSMSGEGNSCALLTCVLQPVGKTPFLVTLCLISCLCIDFSETKQPLQFPAEKPTTLIFMATYMEHKCTACDPIHWLVEESYGEIKEN